MLHLQIIMYLKIIKLRCIIELNSTQAKDTFD